MYFKRLKVPNMKHTLYTAFFFCFATLISCGENEGGGLRMEAAKPALPIVVPGTTPTNTAPLPVNKNIVTGAATPKLNPAHGQPEHRCDISVGAPLPAESLPNVIPSVPTSPVLNSPVQATPALQTTPIAAPVVTAGLNPAHGQPGHRCDVSVGAPLPKEGAPGIKTTTLNSPVIASPAQNTPVIQPNAQVQEASKTVASGLNPAHGQPGHRCDIEVGKPLSTPKKN